MAEQQSPRFLWIGCADSRVTANDVLGLDPGEIFVQRNIANIVHTSDMNLLSVLEFGIESLRVEHIIVCGHYGCGGVVAAMRQRSYGLIDNWLRNIKDIYTRHAAELEAIADENARADRLCELNVMHQVANVCYTTIVQRAWQRNQPLAVHGWIYGLKDGVLKDLEFTVERSDQMPSLYRMSLIR
jgi:carbonic anhydrase